MQYCYTNEWRSARKMKKEYAFEHKRKVRDKAHLRWIKNRYLVVPSFIAAAFIGGVIGGTIARDVYPDAVSLGAIVGMFLGVAVGGPYIVRNLTK